jgi:hypothetical protein
MFADGTGTLWKSMTGTKIRRILGEEPAMNPLLRDSGLLRAFEAGWCGYSLCAVKEFVAGFDRGKAQVPFRGKILAWDIATLREAFELPSPEKPADWKSKWADQAFFDMFTVKRAATNPSSVDTLKPELRVMQKPIRLVQEALLGKSRPTCVNGKQMWVYWTNWWRHIEGSGSSGIACPGIGADWARLVWDDLTSEIVALKNHLSKASVPKKKYACNCGSAITKYLMYYGFTLHELRHPVCPGSLEYGPKSPSGENGASTGMESLWEAVAMAEKSPSGEEDVAPAENFQGCAILRAAAPESSRRTEHAAAEIRASVGGVWVGVQDHAALITKMEELEKNLQRQNEELKELRQENLWLRNRLEMSEIETRERFAKVGEFLNLSSSDLEVHAWLIDGC